ncbi:Hypothetical predicted protein [Pelobates cultripes]|uniref:Uncharacterized protein n=1 Tax=Pelobates cultripes TaxID=61616 RepID=A0AAD1SFI3_PELCU|nr:Hypothetical predicted protein [Pelobates cultripes]
MPVKHHVASPCYACAPKISQELLIHERIRSLKETDIGVCMCECSVRARKLENGTYIRRKNGSKNITASTAPEEVPKNAGRNALSRHH